MAENTNEVRINTEIRGEPARWLEEWIAKGYVSSYRDAVVCALRALHEEIVEEDIKDGQRRTALRCLGEEVPNNGNGRKRLNFTLNGKAAEYLRELQKRGLVLKTPDAIVQAFRALHKKVVEQELKEIQHKRVLKELGYE